MVIRQMQGFMRQKNIELYRRLLANDQMDEAQRKHVERMLTEALAKDLPPNSPEHAELSALARRN